MSKFDEMLAHHRIVVILRAEDSSKFVEVAEVLYSAGIRLIEATLTTPDALQVVKVIRSRLPHDALVGLGSIRTTANVDSAIEANVDFLVTPTVQPQVLAYAQTKEIPVLSGAATPTEIDQAWQSGAAAVKLFPADTLGGVSYLKAVHAPLPDIPLVPTGGVTLSIMEDYLRAGAIAVALGAALLGDAIHGGDLNHLAIRARKFVQVASKAV